MRNKTKTLNDIINIFLKEKILKSTKRGYSRTPKWKEHFKNVSQLWDEFLLGYRCEEEAWYCLLHQIEVPKCAICGALCKFNIKEKYYSSVCENHSANSIPSKREKVSNTKRSFSKEKIQRILKDRRKTNLERYGEENAFSYGSKTFKEVMVQKYGVEYGIQIPGAVEKAKNTCLNNYGVGSIFQDKEKMYNARIQKYGSIENFYYMQNKSREKTLLSLYGKSNVGSIIEFQNKGALKAVESVLKYEVDNNCILYSHALQKYCQGWKSLNIPRFKVGNRYFISNKYLNPLKESSTFRSQGEYRIFKYLKEDLQIKEIIQNSRSIIPPYELDIYIPEFNLAIEFNGVYFHSTKYIEDPNYHLMKSQLCENKGIKLLHVFEDLWYEDPQHYLNILNAYINPIFTSDFKLDIQKDIIKLISLENNLIATLKFKNNNEAIFNCNSNILPLNWDKNLKISPYLRDKFLIIDISTNILELYNSNIWELTECMPPKKWKIKNLNKLVRIPELNLNTHTNSKEFYVFDCGYLKLKYKGDLNV